MTPALLFLYIAAGCIAVGIILYVIGLILDKPAASLDGTQQGLPDKIWEVIKNLIPILTGDAARPKKLQAFGVVLVLLGVLLLIVAVAFLLAPNGTPSGASSGSATPTVSAS